MCAQRVAELSEESDQGIKGNLAGFVGWPCQQRWQLTQTVKFIAGIAWSRRCSSVDKFDWERSTGNEVSGGASKAGSESRRRHPAEGQVALSTQNASNRPGLCRAAWRACQRLADESPLRFALVAVLGLQLFVLVLFRPSYETNDDVFMTMIASGQGFCPAPDEHLLFTNILVGQVLKRLYRAWPGIPWYGGYLLTIHYLAQVAVLYCALMVDKWRTSNAGNRGAFATEQGAPAEATSRGWNLRFALYLIYFAIVELPLLNALQFTATAFLSAEAGLFLLWTVARIRQANPAASVGGPLSAAATLLVVAGLVRPESLFMALLVAAPLGLVLVRQKPWRRSLLPSAGAAALAAVLILLTTAHDRRSYEQDPAWSDFFAYNQWRVKFNDYQWTSHTPRTADVFSSVHWSKNDHEMIARWFFDDPVIYSEANLRSIVTGYPWKSSRLTWGYAWQAVRKVFGDRSVCAILLVLPFFMVAGDRDRRARWAVVGCAAMALALVVLLTLNNKLLPPRIYFPLLSFPLAVALLFPAKSESSAAPVTGFDWDFSKFFDSPWALVAWSARLRGARAVVAMLVVGVAMGGYRQVRRSVRVRRERQALQAFLNDQRPFGHKLVVCWGPALPFEFLSPLDNLSSWSGLPLVNLVWTQRTPWQETTKRRFDISNLPEAIYRRDDVVLVANPTDLALYQVFAKEHFGADVQFVPERAATERFVAGHFRQLTGGEGDLRSDVARGGVATKER